MRRTPSKHKKVKRNAIDKPLESFKIYPSGGSISLKSKEELLEWVFACNIRYFDHFATDPSFDQTNLVLWEDEKGDSPAETKDGQFDIAKMKQLRLEIYYHLEGNQYRKIISITFHLIGKKNSVVISGYGAHDWIDFEFPVIKDLMEMKKKGATYKKIFDKSQKESFANKLINDPKNKGKLLRIDLESQERCISEPEVASVYTDDNMTRNDSYTIPENSSVRGGDSVVDETVDEVDQATQEADPLTDEPPVDTNQLLLEIKHLKQENKFLLHAKNNLQCQVDNLTARFLQQEDSINLLEQKLARMDKDNQDLNGKAWKGRNIAPSPTTNKTENKTFVNQNREESPNRNMSNWENVCKNFNKGNCTRPNCKYEHKLVRKCKFYNRPTGCLKGKDCQFLHVKIRPTNQMNRATEYVNSDQRGGTQFQQQPQQQQNVQDTLKYESQLNSFLEGLSKNVDKLLHASANQIHINPYQIPTAQTYQQQPTQESSLIYNPTTAQTFSPWQQHQYLAQQPGQVNRNQWQYQQVGYPVLN